MILCSLGLLHCWSQCTKACDSFLLCVFGYFNTSILFSSLLRRVVFPVFSSIDEHKDELKLSGITGTSVQTIQQITVVESHLILTQVTCKITETKRLV